VNELSWHRLGSFDRRKGTMVRAFVLYGAQRAVFADVD